MEPIVTNFVVYKTTKMNAVNYDNDEIYKTYPKAKLPYNMEKLPLRFMKSNAGTKLEDLNYWGYRSDEFVKEHEGMHILFGGCSYTWGSGLLKEESWAKKLYNRLSTENKCSGYFNVAFPGSSVFIQVLDMIKYCETYGKPDVIFYGVPGLDRFFGLEVDQETGVALDPPQIGNTFIDLQNGVLPVSRYVSYQSYYMFEKYCESNNIKLFSFSWMPRHFFNKLSEEGAISHFYCYERDDMLASAKEYAANHKGERWVEVSRDGQHLGTAYSQFWADFIYEKYKGKSVQ